MSVKLNLIEELEDELEESEAVIMSMARILAEIAIAFKGVPAKPNHSYGYADLPAIAQALADFAGREQP